MGLANSPTLLNSFRDSQKQTELGQIQVSQTRSISWNSQTPLNLLTNGASLQLLIT